MPLVRLTAKAMTTVKDIASKRGVSLTSVVEGAIENQRRMVFFPEYERELLRRLEYYRQRHQGLRNQGNPSVV